MSSFVKQQSVCVVSFKAVDGFLFVLWLITGTNDCLVLCLLIIVYFLLHLTIFTLCNLYNHFTHWIWLFCLLIKLNSVYLYSAFYNEIVSRCFTKSETQSLDPQVSTAAMRKSLLTGRNLEQDPAYKEELSCWESVRWESEGEKLHWYMLDARDEDEECIRLSISNSLLDLTPSLFVLFGVHGCLYLLKRYLLYF